MKRYSIIVKDLEHCAECGRPNVELHEVFHGTANRKISIKDGLVIPLCKIEHHHGNLIGIHQDRNLELKWQKIAERRWLEYYNKTINDFIQRYGKNLL